MDFSTYMVPAVAVATYLVCAVLKRFMGENSKYLPLVAAMLGVIFAFWYQGTFGFDVFLSGMASGLGATGIDNVVNMNAKKQMD